MRLISFFLSIHSSSPKSARKKMEMDATCASTLALSQANMLSGYQKPLVMTLVTRSICCQISRKVQIESKNVPDRPMVSISKEQKGKQAHAFGRSCGHPALMWCATGRPQRCV
jgi:hypothetical protein